MATMRRYFVTTFGCQMNAHDSERIKGTLESLGFGESPSPEDADVLVFNTCTIREKPDQRFAAHMGNARVRKERDPETIVAVGGCYAEAQRERLFDLYPFVDVAFGPGTIPHLADWIGANGQDVARGRFGTGEERAFSAGLPMHRERRFQAWVQVSMGCNSVCSYCIVPAVRGREVSRRPGEIVAEVERLAAGGVREVTLLGQNVNSWGRDLAPGLRTEFGELLRACDAVDGIERIRFTSPHPKDFREPVIAAMAECDAVCEHVHLPLQSASDDVLARMRRGYTFADFMDIVRALRAAMPRIAITTDILVGFSGESPDDHARTLAALEEIGFDGAFTFAYSEREGTHAARRLPDDIPPEVKQRRLAEVIALQERVSAAKNTAHIGRVERVLLHGAARRSPDQLVGRTGAFRAVIVDRGELAPGQLCDVRIERATSATLFGRVVG
jgi:tRNA-2-methylthio-N6-dimethylallyladenosine synthase